MKVDERGDAMGRQSCRSSFLGHPWLKILRAKDKNFFISAFPPWRSELQRPAAVKGAPWVARRERTLDGEDRCETIRWGGKG